jgi:hypothetical protein
MSMIEPPPRASIGVRAARTVRTIEDRLNSEQVATERLLFGCALSRSGHHTDALVKEGAGNGQANALGSPGDNGDVTGKLEIHTMFLRRNFHPKSG